MHNGTLQDQISSYSVSPYTSELKKIKFSMKEQFKVRNALQRILTVSFTFNEHLLCQRTLNGIFQIKPYILSVDLKKMNFILFLLISVATVDRAQFYVKWSDTGSIQSLSEIRTEVRSHIIIIKRTIVSPIKIAMEAS
jgi:hypothetical protein